MSGYDLISPILIIGRLWDDMAATSFVYLSILSQASQVPTIIKSSGSVPYNDVSSQGFLNSTASLTCNEPFNPNFKSIPQHKGALPQHFIVNLLLIIVIIYIIIIIITKNLFG